jgi:hypothetical protein
MLTEAQLISTRAILQDKTILREYSSICVEEMQSVYGSVKSCDYIIGESSRLKNAHIQEFELNDCKGQPTNYYYTREGGV